MTPKKPEWFELTEEGNSYSGIKRIDKKLPIITLVVAGAVILGGSIFANANNEPSAVAETPAASQSVAATQAPVSQAPVSQATTPASSTPVQPSHVKSSTPKASSGKSSGGVNGLAVPKVSNVPQRGEREHEGGEREGRGFGDGDHEGRDDD
jgi:hypothetical protein